MRKRVDFQLYRDTETEKYYLQDFSSGKQIYLSKKQTSLINELKSKSWEYTILSGKCDNKIEDICSKIIEKNL